ncbi:unnamed protein product [Kuraishia capsulata CBS 1993]|uniref:Large ribosomal subunit protein bL27m n=1 Tax=Kuraishia capsulata CBS 1993 TaxID=1382522 RepID=W6MM77_9ASCO|nr:uncharacterized protein KUCA_T00003610001 [Kuraishia capsulata CBS 1993]CDK27631.1 unnamed protein product [Kuraishia capsulata CBS 1993]
MQLYSIAQLTPRVVGRACSALLRNTLQVNQVRTATKKAAGSKTHMQDSKGRRLGPKKQNNERVKVGQILIRQRGTKFYPGENAGIGKDHTIFALEPGWVRYYLDPFHPKRKFIGVSLDRDTPLPTPHFEPRRRRFGCVELTDSWQASREEERMSRKEYIAFPEILSEKAKRDARRIAKADFYKKALPEFVELSGEELDIAAARMVSVEAMVRGGKSLEDARFYTSYNYGYDKSLEVQRGELSAASAESVKAQYTEIAEKLDAAVVLDCRFKLCKSLTEAETEATRNDILAQLKATEQTPLNAELKAHIASLIDNQVFDLSSRVKLRRRFLKPVASEPVGIVQDDKKTRAVIQRWNYKENKVEVIQRSQEAFGVN